MRWKKLKRLLSVDADNKWLHSHASNPFPFVMSERVVRVFFSARDVEQRSHIHYADFDAAADFKLLHRSRRPVLSPQAWGAFDDRGCSMGCVVTHSAAQLRLYYLGWNLCRDVPFRNSIGYAEWNDSAQRFERPEVGPILDRHRSDAYSLSYPFVLHQPATRSWQMWYGSHLRWGTTINDMVHTIKYATAADGLQWQRAAACFKTTPKAHAFSRPSVIFENNRYGMWYSWRGTSYRIGYAESEDGQTWQRKDRLIGIAPSQEANAWDSEMICYPSVFDMGGSRYMLYNGNQYGKSGFGIAILEQP